MTLQKCFLVVLFSSIAFAAIAQDEEEPKKGFDKSKLFFGGTLGASFGSYTFVNVSPIVGYRFNRFFAVGTGINFIYSSSDYGYYKYEYGIVGLPVFARFYPINFLFIHAQPEMNYNWGKIHYTNGAPDDRLDPKFVPSVLVGAGAAIPLGSNGKSAMTIMYQYDVVQDPRSPYGTNPFLSIGFNF